MTRNEFIQEAKGFQTGTMVIVSGRDGDMVRALLEEARAAIEAESKLALVYDAKEVVTYSQRGYEENAQEARLFEFVKVVSEEFVVLVGNEFDRDDPYQNRTPRTLEIDVAMDIMSPFKVKGITRAYSRNVVTVREIWPFMNSLYWFDVDSDEVTFVKGLDPHR